MTHVCIRPGDLRGLDALATDAVVLPMYRGLHQPRGVAGTVDWRLCGQISGLLIRGDFTGEESDAVLMPTGGRVGADRLFLFGLGSPGPGASIRAAGTCEGLIGRLLQAGSGRHAVGFPAAPEGDAGAELNLALAWIQGVGRHAGSLHTVVLLDLDQRLGRSSNTLRQRAEALGLSWQA